MVRLLVCLLIAFWVAGVPAYGSNAAPIPLRGIVEGFYGDAWSQADRLDMLKFCGEQGLNAYIYAPKDDPYHRAKWREPYPAAKMQELAELVQAAKAHQVEFIFAVSPGIDLHYDGKAGAADKEFLKQKLEAMYALGVRRFAIFFDDIKGMTVKSDVQELDGHRQANFINEIQKEFRALHEDVQPFLAVPTEYYYEDMVNKAEAKPYTQTFSRRLQPDVTVLYTGNGVVTEGITDEELQQADKVYHRNLGIWWNYPVTDYQEAKLALGAIQNLPRQGEIPAIFFNPMKHAQLSKIALATGAEYAQNPEGYVPEVAWYRALRKQYGNLASDMELFASHSQRMENSWAHCGPQDAAPLRQEMNEFWDLWRTGGAEAEVKWFELRQKFDNMDAAGERLEQELPESILRECRPQLALFRELAQTDMQALQLLRMQRFGDGPQVRELLAELRKKQKSFQKREGSVRISDGTARAFLKEVLDHAGKK